MKGFIYKRENNINGKKYIGQTIDIVSRNKKWENLNTPYSGIYINNARKKYGISSFSFEILEEINVDDESILKEKLNELEIKYIKKFNSFGKNGYNMTSGGNNTILPDKKFLIRNKKISESLKGKPRKGIPHNELWKKHIGDGNRGKKLSEEHKNKLSESHKNFVGDKASFYGKHHTEESKRKISENNKSSRAIVQLDLNGNEIKEYKSIKEASNSGFCYQSIFRCCNDIRKTCGGFKWKYKNID